MAKGQDRKKEKKKPKKEKVKKQIKVFLKIKHHNQEGCGVLFQHYLIFLSAYTILDDRATMMRFLIMYWPSRVGTNMACHVIAGNKNKGRNVVHI